MKDNKIGKIIMIITIICATIECGIALGYYMISNIDFDKYKYEYTKEVIKR